MNFPENTQKRMYNKSYSSTISNSDLQRDCNDDVLNIEEEDVSNTYDPVPFPNGKWNVRSYNEHINIRVVAESVDLFDMEFDLVNVEAPIANALRRILIAEVPTMAIEKVFLYQNTSCIQDEVLCHRLGLIPIYADPTKFAFPPSINDTNVAKQPQQINTDYLDEEPMGDPKRNLIFELNVICPSQKEDWSKKRKKIIATGKSPGMNIVGSGDEEETCVREPGNSGNYVLYTSAFKWIPIGEQNQWFHKNPPKLVHGDIILAKMRPGQEIEARCHCVKGIGRDHAKFSPVATATYRLLPSIKLKRSDFNEDQAIRLQCSFSSGVISRDKQNRVFVNDSRLDTCSRNIFMHEDLKDAVQMDKKKTHFIFTIESTGAMPAHRLMDEACRIMKSKAERLRHQISKKLIRLWL